MHENLHHIGHDRPCHFTKAVGIGGHASPTENLTAFAGHTFGDKFGQTSALLFVLRKKQHTNYVCIQCGKVNAFFLRNLPNEFVGHLYQHTRTITGFRIAADRATVFEILEYGNSVADDLMRSSPLDVYNEPDPATVVFKRRIV